MCSVNLGPGWNISQQGFITISESNAIADKNILLRNALNADLREIGSPVLTKEYNKNQISELVLQIQKIRNVAAPKANEESNAAPRMLKLTLTDGETFVQAIETSNIPFISREKTPPGSKILLQNVRIQNGFLLLNQKNTKLLGGNVPHLFEKWELAKSVQHHSRNIASADGPPAWVNFGFKVSNFGEEVKVTDSGKTKEQVKENTEFENLRKDAIAEAATGAVRKIFGAGAKLPNTAPRIDTNKARYEGGKQQIRNKKESKPLKESVPQKPTDKVSLFDFLENKLQIAGGSVDVKSKQDNQDKKSDYEDQNHSYHKNVMPKKEYEQKNSSEFRVNHDYENSSHYVQKQSSSYREMESNKKQYKNRDYSNSTRGYGNDHGKASKEGSKVFDINNSSYRYNARETPVKKSSSAKFQNDSYKNSHDSFESQSNTRNNYNDSAPQKNSQICKRNEEEKMHDSWHYRAPNLVNHEQKGSEVIDNLTEQVVKMSVGGEFASRSLRQHLNLQGKKTNIPKSAVDSNRINDNKSFNVGDECLAKYWEDDKFYPSRVTALTDTTYVVQFKGYGNIEEVLKADCIPLDQERGEKKKYHKGPVEFRRNPKKVLSS
ncbi:tudor domain-containing protein 3 [Coccinella septempunctata]|uniref:tudor domain-containing protein 3 n=1 Tax=Coccinella septempunctata TaxID=41139 RepID=UPI001D05D6F4|nr:tudor domain-containing protein 3 [Coccinella septempunctata]